MRQKPPPTAAATAAPKYAGRVHLHARAFPPELPATAWLSVEDVLQYVPISKSQWYRGVRAGIFPAPHKVNRLAFWKARDIRVLLDMGPRAPRRPKAARIRQDANTGGSEGGASGAQSAAAESGNVLALT